MTSPAELRELLAENSRAMLADAQTTQEAIRAMTAAVQTLTGNPVPAAAAPVLTPQSALQTVRKSSEPNVQLSLSDEQYTAAELGESPRPGAAPPPEGITFIRLMAETDIPETEAKVEALLEFHRRRGLKLRAAQRTLPDGAWVNNNPENVDEYRLPAPPLRSLTHSELNKREQSAVSALAQRQWDKRWSFTYNLDEFESIVSSTFKKEILTYPSYDCYVRMSNAFHYLVLHYRVACWNAITDADMDDTSGLFIPYRPRGVTRQSETVQLQVTPAVYRRYYNAGDSLVHPELDNSTHGLGNIENVATVLGSIRKVHGQATAEMVRDKRCPVQAIYRDRGFIRSDDQGDGQIYHPVNVAFKRHQVMSRVEWDVYCEVIGELLLAFSHQHANTQLTCWKELRDLSKTRCDNYAWELLQIIRRSLPESDTTKILILQALFDDMLNKFDAARHRLSHLIQGMLDVNARILQYGSVSDTEPEDQLLKRVWLKLKIWYRSVPLTDSNPLVVAWCSFVAQYK